MVLLGHGSRAEALLWYAEGCPEGGYEGSEDGSEAPLLEFRAGSNGMGLASQCEPQISCLLGPLHQIGQYVYDQG